jgi:tetratricopeptide (TPR) repeat protein
MLKEYSADFLEVLDVYYPLPQEVKLSGQTDHQIADKVAITLQEKQLRVHNLADQPQYLERIVVGEQTTELSAILAGGEEIILQMAADGQEIALHMRIASRLDMIVPRGHALIRHRAERYNPDSIFDVGLALVRRDSDEREIEQLRQALRYAPQDAISAAKLGEQLLQNGEYLEARHWLLEAQERCYRLPDRGNRVAQNLRQVERYLEQMRMQNRMAEELRIISLSSSGAQAADDVAVDI